MSSKADVFLSEGGEKEPMEGPFPCFLCNEEFDTETSLRDHRKTAHAGKKSGDEDSKTAGLLGAGGVDQPSFSSFNQKPVQITLSLKGFMEKNDNLTPSGLPEEEEQQALTLSKVGPLHATPCFLCGQEFPNSVELLQHRSNVHGVRSILKPWYGGGGARLRLSTPKPQKVFKTPKRRRSEEDEGSLCDVCEQTFESKEELEAHKVDEHGIPPKVLDGKKVDKEMDVFCHICQRHFSSENFLNRHRLRYHPQLLAEKKQDFICDLCFRAFQAESGLKIHKSRVHGEEEAKATTETAPKLKRKQKLEEEEDVEAWCDLCSVGFPTSKSLVAHKDRFHPDEKVKFIKIKEKKPEEKGANKCQECGKSFQNRRGMLTHRTRMHSARRIKTAAIVSAGEIEDEEEEEMEENENILEEYEKGSEGDEKEALESKIEEKTGKVEETKGAGKIEEKKKEIVEKKKDVGKIEEEDDEDEEKDEEEEEDLFCEICLKAFTNPGSFDYHMSKVHGNLKMEKEGETFECETCGKRYASVQAYKAHVTKTHLEEDKGSEEEEDEEEEEDTECAYCARHFSNSGELSLHKAEKHSKDVKKNTPLKFRCGECETQRDFANQKALKTHNDRVHPETKTKPMESYKCKQCKQSFSTAIGVKRHTTMVHGKKSVPK